jgi:hypothetical protein
MRFILASSFVVFSAFGNIAFGQVGSAVPVVAPVNDADKPRVYITDSNSWSQQGSAGGAHGVFAASSSGGARPQTAEIIKTFGQRCPQVIVNNRSEAANYIVELDHEGGKGLLAHKDKIAVFVQKSGDSIFSKSTMSVGGSVQDACAAVLTHWSVNANELRQAVAGYGEGGYNQAGYGGGAVNAAAQSSSIAVDASTPNCDIEVDGNFVGNTPSTINLAPGKHHVVVKKTGFQDWTRNMMVGSGAIRLNAEMVAK